MISTCMVVKYVHDGLSLYLLSEAVSLSVKLPGLLIKLPKDFLKKNKKNFIGILVPSVIYLIKK